METEKGRGGRGRVGAEREGQRVGRRVRELKRREGPNSPFFRKLGQPGLLPGNGCVIPRRNVNN